MNPKRCRVIIQYLREAAARRIFSLRRKFLYYGIIVILRSVYFNI